MYPAEKLMAENSTTTPALITQVMMGLTVAVESDMLARRLFLDVARSLGETDRRLALLPGGPGGTATRGCLRRGAPREGLVSVY